MISASLYVQALRFYQQGRVVICADEKTGMQILQRRYPTQPVQPGKPEKRETRVHPPWGARVISLVCGADGTARVESRPDAHQCRLGCPFGNVVHQLPAMQRYDWVIDNLQYPLSLDVCRLVAQWCAVPYCPKALRRGVQRRAFLSDPTHQHVFHFTPKPWDHGSIKSSCGLAFWPVGFSNAVIFASAHDFETRLGDFMELYNTHHAHPYRWTYTGQTLGAAPPLANTVASAVRDGPWFSHRPQRFERALYPPRLTSAPQDYW